MLNLTESGILYISNYAVIWGLLGGNSMSTPRGKQSQNRTAVFSEATQDLFQKDSRVKI